MRAKLDLGSSASRSLFPIVVVFSGLSNEKNPDEDFTVCSVPGLTANTYIDSHNKDISNIYFMRSGIKHVQFCDWYEKNITFLK